MPITETLLQQVRGNDPRLIVIEELKDQILSIKDLQNLQSALQFNTVVGRIIWGKTQEQHDAKLLKAIENRLSENNHNYRD